MAAGATPDGAAPLRVLVLEDQADDAELVVRALRRDGLVVEPTVVADERSYLEGLAAEPDVIISDFHLPGFDGRRAVDLARRAGTDAPFILVSGVLAEDEALELYQYGANDYLLKDRLARLGSSVRQAIAQRDQHRRELEAVEALRSSEQRFRSLVQNGSAVIATVDAAGTITYISPSVERVTGFPAEHYLGTSVVEHVHPDDDATGGMQRTLAEPASVRTARRRIQRWDGGWVWVESTGTNLLHDPDVGAVILNFYDVTPHEQALGAVSASEERYRRIVEGTQEAILVLDLDGAITFASPRADDLFGVSAGALLTQSISEIVPDEQARLAFMGERDHDRRRVEVLLGTPPDARWVSVASDPLHGPTGDLVGRLVLASDVTERRKAEAQVRLQARLLDSVGEAVFALDNEGKVLYWNPAAEHMFRIARRDALGSPIAEVVAERYRKATEAMIRRMRTSDHWSGEIRMVRNDGGSFPALMTTSPAIGERGNVVGTLFVVVDMTERVQAASELEARARQQSAVAAMGNRALAERDPAVLVHEVLLAATEELAVDRASYFELDETGEMLVLRAVAGDSPDLVGTLVVPADPEHMMGWVLHNGGPLAVQDFDDEERVDLAQQIRELGVRSGVGVMVGSEEQPFGVLALGHTTPRAYGDQELDFITGLANVLAASIDRHRSDAELERLALHDSVTGLANRRSFEVQGRSLLEQTGAGDEAALLLFDVRSLKLINDALGHLVGDEVLRRTADRINEVAPIGAVVARLSGDGFAVLQAGIRSPEHADALARSIAEELAAPHDVEGVEVFAPVSAGVAVTDLSLEEGGQDGDRLQQLLRHADLALQRAKPLGGGRIERFDEALRDDAATHLRMVNGLRVAAEQGELHLRYQPEVPLQPGGAIWAEALLRWDHPELGPIGPDQFIPLAEESGSIIEIGAWVLRIACHQMREWADAGAAMPAVLAVNLSPRQLAHPDLVETVTTILEEEGVRPEQMALEITETAVMADPAGALDTVRRLAALGVLVAIDDFGTGYSSLALLQRFPVGALKVDRTFVSGLGSSPSDRSIVAAVIGLASALGLVTVAEGVETAEQLAQLTEMGCDVGQGYYWAKPLLPDDLVRWIEAHQDSESGPVPGAPERGR